jgi:hypothetical protein
MNMFVVLQKGDGKLHLLPTSDISIDNRVAIEIVTPPLDGMILPGITRDSVLTLAREHVSGKKTLPNIPKKLIVSERPITMKEVKDAVASDSLVEIFGSGMCLIGCPTQPRCLRYYRNGRCDQHCQQDRLPRRRYQSPCRGRWYGTDIEGNLDRACWPPGWHYSKRMERQCR